MAVQHDDNTLCWVYVLRNRDDGYRICYGLEKPEQLKPAATGEELVWQRCFRGVANAMAYKLLLENLDYATIKYIIDSTPASQDCFG